MATQLLYWIFFHKINLDWHIIISSSRLVVVVLFTISELIHLISWVWPRHFYFSLGSYKKEQQSKESSEINCVLSTTASTIFFLTLTPHLGFTSSDHRCCINSFTVLAVSISSHLMTSMWCWVTPGKWFNTRWSSIRHSLKTWDCWLDLGLTAWCCLTLLLLRLETGQSVCNTFEVGGPWGVLC